MAKLEKLTDEQVALMAVVRDKAIDRALFAEPTIDALKARKAVNWMYEKAGKKAPKFFIQVSSPLALQYAANLMKNPGAQVRAQVWDQVWDQVGDQVRDQVGDQVGDQVRDQVGDQVGDQVRAQVWDQVGAQVRDQKLEVFNWAYNGLSWDSGWVAFYDFFQEAGIIERHVEFEQYAELLESGVFMSLLFENCAIVCERPKIVHRSDNNALHYDQGAAISWNDSYEVYSLFGVRFEKDLYWKVVNREITIQDMMTNIPNADQRSVALMLADPEEMLKSMKAKLVHTSVKKTRAKEPTKLYQVPNFMDTGETEYAMTMYCPSTNRPFIEWVEPETGSKLDADLAQAVAFGITKEQYLAIRPDEEA